MKNERTIQKDIPSKEKGILLSMLLIPCLLVLTRPLDNDIWFLLNGGRYVLENGIPHTEPFTIHQGWHFVMQQWLSGVMFWVTYQNLGEMGLRVLVLLFYGCIVSLMYRLCMKVSAGNFLVSYATTLISSVLLFPFMTQRPFIFSSLLFLVEIYALESYVIRSDKKYLHVLPFLSMLLVNLHAAMWPMLFVIMIPYFIDSFCFRLGILKSTGYEKKGVFLVALAMILAGFVNPYGLEAMTYVFRSYGYPEINALIYEMSVLDVNTVIGKIIFLIFFIQLMIYSYGLIKKDYIGVRYILLTSGTAYMALSSIRSLSIFAVCGFFPVAHFLKDLKIKKTRKETPRLRKFLVAALASAIFVEGNQLVSSSSNVTEYDDLNSAIDYIIDNEGTEEIILYTGYNDGNLTEFRGIPSYMDSRAEVFVKKNNKKDDVMLEYYKLQIGKQYYKSFLDKYAFTHLIINQDDILDAYLPHDPDYEKVYSNESYTLYTK